jgi:hypothetical protein
VYKKCSKFRRIVVGLSSDKKTAGGSLGCKRNSYAIPSDYDRCWLAGEDPPFEWAKDAIKPIWNYPGPGDVVGCGLLLNPAKELSIFFTANGILMGQFPLSLLY